LSAPTRIEAPKDFQQMRRAAMALNFDWRDSAECYDALYRESTRAGDPRPRRLRIEAAALLISAEEAPSRSEPKRSDDARHTFATGANSDRAIFAALASPHGLRQNDRC
jgi:hypothetical protein